MTAFWDIAPCGLVEADRRFRGAYCLHHQDDDDGRTNLPLERRFTCTRLRGTTSQKAVIFNIKLFSE
jgi:hypothetical protein